MSNSKAIRPWSEIYSLDIVIPSEGRAVGKVVDFYFKDGTNAIYALCVRTRLQGDLALPVTGIKSIDANAVTIPNEQMLTRALPPLTRAQDLLGRAVVDEKGKNVGSIGEIFLATDPPVALRVVGFGRAATNRFSSRKFTADEVIRYDDDAVVIYDAAARRLQH
ncbi:MAG TPA: PRC-barrel domain-containing protein [Ktedonosporobacter sp.]|nr:PRC-barrel domain-containing protein [Ktedonosporobacter sp.]